MKKVALLLAFLLAAACASSSGDAKPNTGPSVTLEQLDAGGTNFTGPVNLRYRVTVHNETEQQVTLRRVELHSTSGGTYQLPTRQVNVNLLVAPHSSDSVDISVWGNAISSMRNYVPEATSISGMAYFESPAGLMQSIFHATFAIRGQ